MKRSTSPLYLERLEDRTVPSGPGDIEWLQQFGSDAGGSDQGPDPAHAVDAAGNIYVAGDLPHVLPGQTSAGGVDAFVRKYDASGNEVWTRQFGTAGQDQAVAVAVDAGGVYVVGMTDGALPGQTSAGDRDAYIRKYDTDGNELWTRQFGTSRDDHAYGVAVDASGVYVVGDVTGTLPGQTSSGGGEDAFVRKYDANGSELWTRQFGSPPVPFGGGTGANCVAVNASGVYVGGATSGLLPGQTKTGPFFGFNDAFVRKYDANGAEQWTRQFDGGDNLSDLVSGIAVDATGVYVAGVLTGPAPGQTGSGNTHAFVRKFDGDGTELWTSHFPTSSSANRAFDVSADASGVYVAGATDSPLPGQRGAGGTDAFVRKYDGNGAELWTRQFGTTGVDEALGVAANAAGVFVVGMEGAASGDSGHSFTRKYDSSGTEIWTRRFGPLGNGLVDAARAVDADGNVYVAGDVEGALPNQTSALQADAFLRKYDPAGHELWTRQFGTDGFDQALAVTVDGSGAYVAGYTDGALAGQGSAGGPDAFVHKYDANGNELWTRQFGTVVADAITAIAADSSGIYVSGFTSGALAGQSSSGGQDAFVRKYDPAGNVLWTRQFGTAGLDEPTGSAVDAGGVYISGYVTGVFAGQTSAGNGDAFVRKYDAAGNELWTRQFGTSSADEAYGIAADSSGVYVAGRTAGALAGQSNAGLTDAFLRKYDGNGGELWTRQFGTSAADQALGVFAGPAGVYVAGSTEGALPGQANAGSDDAFVRRYSAGGIEQWTGQFGTAESDVAAGVAMSATGLFVVGSTAGTFPNQTSAGGQDAFVARLTDSAPNTPPAQLVLGLDAPSIHENGSVTLSGVFTDPDATDVHTVVIDWGPGESSTPLYLSAAATTFSASHTYLDDNPTATSSDVYHIHAIIADVGASTSASVALTVNNVAPVIGSLTSSSPDCGDARQGEAVSIQGSFGDVGTADTHTAIVNWGDGTTAAATVNESGATGTFTASHVYATGGIFTIATTLKDDDGGTDTRTTTAVVAGVRLSGDGVLQIIGTDGRDRVTIRSGSSDDDDCDDRCGPGDGLLHVSARLDVPGGCGDDGDDGDHQADLTFDPSRVKSILVRLCDGDDSLSIHHQVTIAAVVDGGAGNDRIRTGGGNDVIDGGDGNDVITAGAGNDLVRGGAGDDRLNGNAGDDILVGGDGDDLIIGEQGRDLLIGGRGADRIVGNEDDDLLVAGYTAHDGNDAALTAILAEWTSAGSYGVRVANVQHGAGLAAGFRLDGDDGALQTVFNDDSVDTLTGSQGQDWFLANLNADNGGALDVVTDKSAKEIWSDTDF